MSKIPGLNVPKRIHVFRYLSSLQFTVYLLFLDLKPKACSRQFEMGLLFLRFKVYRALNISLGGRVDLGTGSQVIIFRARYSLNFSLGPFQIVESKLSAPNQEREDKQ